MRLTSLTILLVAACGGSGSGDRVDDFIGTWTYNAGSMGVADCQDNQLDTNEALTGTFVLQMGTMSDLIIAPEPDDECPPTGFNVDGDDATVVAGTCSVTDQGITFKSDTATGKLTLNDDGTMMMGNVTGTLTISGGFNTTCSVVTSISATKSGT